MERKIFSKKSSLYRVYERNQQFAKRKCSLSERLNHNESIVETLREYQKSLNRNEKNKLAEFFSKKSHENGRKRKGCHRILNSYYKKKIDVGTDPGLRQNKFVVIKESVHDFYLDDRNSTQSPGVKETITRRKVKMRKRYMTDTIKNLYAKFREERGLHISKALFYRLRPFWVVRAKLTSRDTCLCKDHANFKFLVERLHNLKIINAKNTTDCLKFSCCDPLTAECLNETCNLCKNSRLLCPEDLKNQETFYYK